MKIIIIEGPDNTGKNTLINSIIESNNIVKLIHCGTPKSKEDPFTEQKQLFTKLANIAIDEYRKGTTDILIFNRFYQGEYVYGQMYRNISSIDIRMFIRQLEKMLINNIMDDDLYYVQLSSSSANLLVGNDDGKSLSDGKKNLIIIENKLFCEVFNFSIIFNKKMIYVNNGDNFRSREDILEEFNNFINK